MTWIFIKSTLKEYIMTTNSRSYLYNPDLTNQLELMKKDIAVLQEQVKNLTTLFGSAVTLSDLGLSEKRLKTLTSNNGELINEIQQKLSLVVLPNDTRFFLEQSEIEDFRNNFQKLVAMIADVEILYKDMVSYVSNATLRQRR